ncbi:MAG: hypothetical protein WC773_03985 [Patescibacteria group bacterium]|jgi:hypothetical protein
MNVILFYLFFVGCCVGILLAFLRIASRLWVPKGEKTISTIDQIVPIYFCTVSIVLLLVYGVLEAAIVTVMGGSWCYCRWLKQRKQRQARPYTGWYYCFGRHKFLVDYDARQSAPFGRLTRLLGLGYFVSGFRILEGNARGQRYPERQMTAKMIVIANDRSMTPQQFSAKVDSLQAQLDSNLTVLVDDDEVRVTPGHPWVNPFPEVLVSIQDAKLLHATNCKGFLVPYAKS